MTKFLKSFAILILFVGCKGDNPLAVLNQDLINTYKQDPTPITGNELIKDILDKTKSEDDKSKQNSLIEYGYQIAKDQNITSRHAAFLFPLLKDAVGSPDYADKLYELAGLMKKMKKESAANTLYMSLLDNHKDYGEIGKIQQMLPDTLPAVDKYIFSLGEKLFVNVDNTGINRNAAMEYVDACEAFALGYPNSPETAENLFKSAEVAKSIRTFGKSLSLYDWILDKYPNYEKAPTAMFLKAFIIENNIKDDAKAKEIYLKFIASYPNHDLADDVEFLLENIGKSDEEILKMIEEKRSENAQ